MMSPSTHSIHSDTTSTLTNASSSTNLTVTHVLDKFNGTLNSQSLQSSFESFKVGALLTTLLAHADVVEVVEMTEPPAAAYTSESVLPGSFLNSPRAISSALLSFPDISEADKVLAESVNIRVRKYMQKYDNSHDYEHIQRVVANGARIWCSDTSFAKDMDPLVVFLGCMMHDVGDHKYLKPFQSGPKIKERLLLKCGASPELARKVQIIATHVSYTFEKKNPAAVLQVLRDYPELAIVQDADRLDALGPVGQARCFAFHGVSPRFRRMTIHAAVQHMWEKLYRLPGLMKTSYGREEAERLWQWNVGFQKEWERQTQVGNVLQK